jgi:hypothetical protein
VDGEGEGEVGSGCGCGGVSFWSREEKRVCVVCFVVWFFLLLLHALSYLIRFKIKQRKQKKKINFKRWERGGVGSKEEEGTSQGGRGRGGGGEGEGERERRQRKKTKKKTAKNGTTAFNSISPRHTSSHPHHITPHHTTPSPYLISSPSHHHLHNSSALLAWWLVAGR